MVRVIAYTYDAAAHCVDCALTRFGVALNRPATTDFEGNRIHPVFSTDENIDGLTCDDCACIIIEPLHAHL